MQRSAGRPAGSASTRVRPVVQQDEVERARPVSRGHAGPERRVGVHPLTGRRAREELEEDLEVPRSADHLLDPHYRDQRLGKRRAHAPVALGLDDADRPGLGDGEVRAARSRRAPAGRPREGGGAPPPRARRARPTDPAARAARGTDRESRSGSCGSPGTRRWEGRSPASWTISSARSVSIGRIPSASSASLSRISSVASDFTFTTSAAPVGRTSPTTIAFASAASRAQ